ncbi:Uncharacterised protein [Yersinia massiliensis]|uniref:hypothetical protein n=1 Tax=Yersinia massiliensis TaxID=419257 RepID=UPI0005DFC51D|nr:hypothetical protein [Yersinia massiliensis]CNI67809.1 Uncharacterised protein [Yersinia massiliensis]HDL7468077.1 hypothetical protein [Yersinia enterocolitica]
MAVKHSARRYDIFDAAEMANEKANVKLITSDPMKINWTWDDKYYEIEIDANEEEEIILLELFRAATKMATM